MVGAAESRAGRHSAGELSAGTGALIEVFWSLCGWLINALVACGSEAPATGLSGCAGHGNPHKKAFDQAATLRASLERSKLCGMARRGAVGGAPQT